MNYKPDWVVFTIALVYCAGVLYLCGVTIDDKLANLTRLGVIAVAISYLISIYPKD